MSLKKEIILVNEFSVPLPGGKGSRGGTPGSYVERYMAREDATESLAPIQRLRTDDFILRYMAREDAVETAVTRSEVKSQMRKAQGQGGVAFGYGSVSLSDEQLRAAAGDIQSLFENGHTVMKTVLSFSEEYLKRHGLIDQDFHCTTAGDYRGQVDQMKLRMAVMRGFERMSQGNSGFDDLRWIGVFQFDTEHVHLHAALVDAGRGTLAKDGHQRGKLLDRHKSRLRRGIDSFLDEKQTVKHLSSAVGYERRNVTTFIKRWAHERMREDSLPQFLLACLPEDRSLWRAGTNDRRMRKANQIVTEMVIEQLERPGSPLPQAMEQIIAYANSRRDTERLTTSQWQRLVDNGRGQIVERAVNGVYQMLQSLPRDELRVRTPMLDLMGMDYEQMAALASERNDDPQTQEEDIVSFGFRLRSYSSRLEHHRTQARHHRELTRTWERADAVGAAVEESRPLYDFYRFEHAHHLRLLSKYQHFLPFADDASQWYDEQKRLSDYGQNLLSLLALRGDGSLQRMKDPEEAERLGREIYGQTGGRLLTQGKAGRAVLDHRIATMRQNYEERVSDLRDELALSGLTLRPARADEASSTDRIAQTPAGMTRTDSGLLVPDLRIDQGARYDFEEVKALDLHRLSYDFFSDVEIGERAFQAFTQESLQRRELLVGAMNYLERSGQSQAIRELPVADVAAMSALAEQLTAERAKTGVPVLHSRFAELRAEQTERERVRREAATALDAGLAVRVQETTDRAAREFIQRQELLSLVGSSVEMEPDQGSNRGPSLLESRLGSKIE